MTMVGSAEGHDYSTLKGVLGLGFASHSPKGIRLRPFGERLRRKRSNASVQPSYKDVFSSLLDSTLYFDHYLL